VFLNPLLARQLRLCFFLRPTVFLPRGGFILGSILGIFLVSWKIINRFLSNELNKAIEKATRQKAPPESKAV